MLKIYFKNSILQENQQSAELLLHFGKCSHRLNSTNKQGQAMFSGRENFQIKYIG